MRVYLRKKTNLNYLMNNRKNGESSMKKVLFVIPVVSLFVIGCGDSEEVNFNVSAATQNLGYYAEENVSEDTVVSVNKDVSVAPDDSEDEWYYNTYVIPANKKDEFERIIEDNPIDRDVFLGPNETTEARIKMALKYKDLWQREIENALLVIKDNMSSNDYSKIEDSYVAFTDYSDSMTSAETKLFYLTGEYGDNETYPHVSEAGALRMKDYAISVLSIEYAMTGNVEFAYDDYAEAEDESEVSN